MKARVKTALPNLRSWVLLRAEVAAGLKKPQGVPWAKAVPGLVTCHNIRQSLVTVLVPNRLAMCPGWVGPAVWGFPWFSAFILSLSNGLHSYVLSAAQSCYNSLCSTSLRARLCTGSRKYMYSVGCGSCFICFMEASICFIINNNRC